MQRIEVPQTYKAQSLEWQVEQLVAVAEGKKNGSARVQAIKALREILNDPEEPRTWRKKEALEMKKKMPEALADRLKEADDGYKN